jgi:hypothetical protein
VKKSSTHGIHRTRLHCLYAIAADNAHSTQPIKIKASAVNGTLADHQSIKQQKADLYKAMLMWPIAGSFCMKTVAKVSMNVATPKFGVIESY